MTTDVSPEERAAIQDLMMRYCHAIDTGDVEGYVAAFAVDGVFRSAGGFRYEGADGIRKFITEFKTRPHAPHSQHWMQQVHIRRDGDRIVARSYWMIATTTELAVRQFSYSDDVFVKVGGKWRIKDRLISNWDKQPPGPLPRE